MGKALYKAIPSLDYYTGQTFNYYNDQFLMGKPLSLYFCKVMRLAGIPPSAGKEETTRQEFAEGGRKHGVRMGLRILWVLQSRLLNTLHI